MTSLVHRSSQPRALSLSRPAAQTSSKASPGLRSNAGLEHLAFSSTLLEATVYNSRISITYATHPQGQTVLTPLQMPLFHTGLLFSLSIGVTRVQVLWVVHSALTPVTWEPWHSKHHFNTVTLFLWHQNINWFTDVSAVRETYPTSSDKKVRLERPVQYQSLSQQLF